MLCHIICTDAIFSSGAPASRSAAAWVTSSCILCHISIHILCHINHTCYVTSSYIACSLVVRRPLASPLPVCVQMMWHSMYGGVTYYVWWCDREDGVSAGVVWWCDIVCMLMWHNMYDDGVSEGVCTLQNALSYCRMCSLRMVQVQMSVSHHHTSYVTSSYDTCTDTIFSVTSSYIVCHTTIHAMSHHHT